MKQMKFLMATLLIFISVSLTSCLNGEENNIVTASEIVKVNDSYGIYTFTNASGITLEPDKAIISFTGKMALIYYQYDRTTIQQNAKSVKITLLTDPKCIDGTAINTDPEQEIKENAPMITLEPSTDYGTLKGALYDKGTLIIPLAYKIKAVNTADEAAAEFKKHSFTLSYNPDETATDKTLKLVFYHNIEDAVGETVERTKDAYDYKSYDLNEVLNLFKAKNGSNPTKITITIQENRNNNRLDQATSITYPYDYKFTE